MKKINILFALIIGIGFSINAFAEDICTYTSLTDPDVPALFTSCTQVTVSGDFTTVLNSNIPDDVEMNIGGDLAVTGGSGFIIGSANGSDVTIAGNVNNTKKILLNGTSRLTIGEELSTSTVTTSNTLQICDNSVVEIWGDLSTAGKIIIETNAMLIIHGNLTMTSSAGNLFDGDLIVTGNADINKCQITSSGNFVIGGNLVVSQVDTTISGNIYSINGGTVSLPGAYSGYTIQDLAELEINDPDLYTELINSGVVTTAYTWNASVNTMWNNASNWSEGRVPGRYTNVVIPSTSGNDPIIDNSTAVTVKNLTIETGAAVTMSAGARLCVVYDLTNNGTFTLNNTVSEPAALIVEGESTGNIVVNWDDLSNMAWWHIGFSTANVTQSMFDNSLTQDKYAINRYSAGWDRVAGINNNYSNTYSFSDPLEGYSLIIQDAGLTLNYSGPLNNDASYSTSNLSEGWHLIANPYASYIDVSAESGFEMTNFVQTVYIDTYDDQSCTYNITTGVSANQGSQFIAPGQSMWLNSTNATNSITIPSECRDLCEESVGILKSATAPGMSDVFRLELRNELGYSDEMVAAFSANGYNDIMTTMDSPKKMNGSDAYPNIYSLKDNTALVINTLPKSELNASLPLGFKVATVGNYTMVATNLNAFLAQTDIYLLDKENDLTIDLRETESLRFTTTTTVDNERFELLFVPSLTRDDISTQRDIEVTNNDVDIYSINQKGYININSEKHHANSTQIKIYNMKGIVVKEIKSTENNISFDIPNKNTLYLVQVIMNNKVYCGKIISN